MASSRCRRQGSGFLRWPRYNFRSLPQDVYRRPASSSGTFPAQRQPPHRAHPAAARSREIHDGRGDPHHRRRSGQRMAGDQPSSTSSPRCIPTERIVLENLKTHSDHRARHRSDRAARPRPARADRRAAAHRQDHPAQGHRPVDPREFAGDQAHPAARRRAARGSHRLQALADELRNLQLDLRRESAAPHAGRGARVSDRAKRLVELRRHVVILLDSITRLSRGYNNLQPGKGRHHVRRRRLEGAGEAEEILQRRAQHRGRRSLTILATASSRRTAGWTT